MKVKDRLAKVPDLYELDFDLMPRAFPNTGKFNGKDNQTISDSCINKDDYIDTLYGLHEYMVYTMITIYCKSLKALHKVMTMKFPERANVDPFLVLGVSMRKSLVTMYERESKELYSFAGHLIGYNGLDTVFLMVRDMFSEPNYYKNYELHRYDEFVNVMLTVLGPHGFEPLLPESEERKDRSSYVSVKGEGNLWN